MYKFVMQKFFISVAKIGETLLELKMQAIINENMIG